MNADIYLMRHGETDANKRHEMQGQRDIPLNETGKEQARNAAELYKLWDVKFDEVWTSPLCRAKVTGELASGIPQENFHIDNRIIECGFGPYEGHIYEELPKEVLDWSDDPWSLPPVPGIEKLEDLQERMVSFIESLKDRVMAMPGDGTKTILVVTHGTALHALLVKMPGEGRDRWFEPLGNCSIYRTHLRDGEFDRPRLLTKPKPTYD